MPDHRLEKTRATLPAGYQFGDAGTWRRPSENAAEQLALRACRHDRAAYDYMIRAYRCACGMTVTTDAEAARRRRNVIGADSWD